MMKNAVDWLKSESEVLGKSVTALWLKNRPELKTVNKQQSAENSLSAKDVSKVVSATSNEGFLFAVGVFFVNGPPVS